MRSNARYISPRTEWDYRQYARALAKFFGELPLEEIHVGHFREYHRGRAFCDHAIAHWDKPAGANRIRKEIGLLVRVMKVAGAWTEEHEKFFEPLAPVHNDVGRAMNLEEQDRFLRIAASRERWALIYWYSVLALQTTASTNELRGLRHADINLEQRVIQVRSATAKNKFRIRTIPIETKLGLWCLERLIERAHHLGSRMPHHFLFPLRLSRKRFDPVESMSDSGLKKLWSEVREAAALEWVRPYDLRHTGLTRMAEAGVPVHVMMAFAGHVSMKMQMHYTAITMAAKRSWIQSAWPEEMPPKMGSATVSAGVLDAARYR